MLPPSVIVHHAHHLGALATITHRRLVISGASRNGGALSALAARLRRAGHEVLDCSGDVPVTAGAVARARRTIEALLVADAAVFGPDWGEDADSVATRETADALGLPTYDLTADDLAVPLIA